MSKMRCVESSEISKGFLIKKSNQSEPVMDIRHHHPGKESSDVTLFLRAKFPCQTLLQRSDGKHYD